VPDVGVSNGLAWNATGETVYFIDSYARTLSAFDYDLGRGELSGRRIVRTFPAEGGLPDGMTIDRAGRLWIALWGGGAVVCCDPQTGAELARVEVPASLTTSCAFGGPALDELFITSARINLTPEQLAREPLAGSIFRVRPGAVGLPAALFGG
jgi:sugar lactone lactonase YvrE